jgi:hypothetical protein
LGIAERSKKRYNSAAFEGGFGFGFFSASQRSEPFPKLDFAKRFSTHPANSPNGSQ